MKDLFGIESVPPKKHYNGENQKAQSLHAQLIKLHGEVDNKCKNCDHLYVKEYAGRYFKCSIADPKLASGPSGDWRANWKACGKFVLQVDEELADIPGRKEKFDSKASNSEQNFLNKKTRQ